MFSLGRRGEIILVGEGFLKRGNQDLHLRIWQSRRSENTGHLIYFYVVAELGESRKFAVRLVSLRSGNIEHAQPFFLVKRRIAVERASAHFGLIAG